MPDCLIVDDESELADAIKDYFNLFSVTADAVYDLQSAEQYPEPFSVMLLDINLPDGSGYVLAARLRACFPQTKILFLSARREDFDIIQGYVSGGDDYIVKPTSLPVLLAKVKHALGETERIPINDIVVDIKNRTVIKGGETVDLKNMEFNLFNYLYQNRGAVLDKEDIIKAVWGDGYYSDNTLNVHINRLREKLGDTEGATIQTVWGVGYRFRK